MGSHRGAGDHRRRVVGARRVWSSEFRRSGGIPETKEPSPAHFHRDARLWSHVPMAVGSILPGAHGGRRGMAAWRYTEVETDVKGEREEGAGIWDSGSSFRERHAFTTHLPSTSP